MPDLSKQKAKPDAARSLGAEEKALDLRKAGASYRKIAKAMDCSVAQSHKLVARAMKRLVERCSDGAEKVRVLELERLDDMLMGLWPNANRGNAQAVEKVLKIMERRAKLLGLDAPTKVAPTTPDGQQPYAPMSDTELDARIRELAGKLEGSQVHGVG